MTIHFAKTEEEKVGAKEKIPGILQNLAKMLNANNGGAGFFVGKSITLADLAVFTVLDTLFTKIPDIKTKAPKLGALVDRVASQQRIAAWLAKRPVTEI